MSNKVIYRRPTANTYLTGTSDNARGVLPAVYEGLVVDVILNHTHPEYSRVDGHNVGTVKVRIFDVNHGADNSQLSYAYPMDPSMGSYPLIGELVLINKVRGDYYYSSKVAVTRRLQENALIGANAALNNQAANNISTAVNNLTEAESQSHKFGRYFKPDSRVRPLMHFEGDTLLQGRMGHSIRFGSSRVDPSSDSMAPNIILRTGQAARAENESSSITTSFGLILEDVNADASSIWMTSDQVVPFLPATVDASSYARSINDAPQKFDKAQIIINSDNIILNAKQKSILLFANNEIYLNSKSNVSIDTSKSINLAANVAISNKAVAKIENIAGGTYSISAGGTVSVNSKYAISLASKKIYIGSSPLLVDIADVAGTVIDIATGAANGDDVFGIPDSIDAEIASAALGTAALILGGGGVEPEPMVCGTRLAEFLDDLIKIFSSNAILGIAATGPVTIHPIIKLQLIAARRKLRISSIGNITGPPSYFKNAVFNSEDNFVSYKNDPSNINIAAAQVGLELSEFVSSQTGDGNRPEPTSTDGDRWPITSSDYKST